jgi:acetate---CoA ligase (ADP-forming)
MAAVGNPVDVIGDAPSSRYEDAFKILTGKEDIDAIITIVTPQMMTDAEAIAHVIASYRQKKPILPVFMGGASVEKGVFVLKDNGMANFDFSIDVVKILDALAGGEKKQYALVTPKTADASPLVMLSIAETQALLDSYGMKLDGFLMKDKSQINDSLWSIGVGPFVIKVVSQALVHKTDMHAVALNLADSTDVTAAWNTMEADIATRMPDAKIDGMLVQHMTKGKEIIIGMKRDPIFGPVVVFGLGGIFVEILKDISMRVAPIEKDEARRQIEEIKGFDILMGARGQASVDLDALAGILVSVSRLAAEHPEIEEIDFNPVIATESDAVIVDARFMTKAALPEFPEARLIVENKAETA